jgi:hypothetical protein
MSVEKEGIQAMSKSGWRAIVTIAILGVVALGACGDEGGGGGTDGGTGGGEEFVVGISWNNFNEPRWAAFDKPKLVESIEAHGGTLVERNAGDSTDNIPKA